MPLSLQGSLNWLTRTKSFRRLTKWAFVQCDASGNGRLTKTELYSGILLVHLQLAKYAGAAACYPPTKAVIDKLFTASDDDQSGYIDEDEFSKIMVICCAQIASRIVVYFAILVLFANLLAEYMILALINLDEYLGWNVAMQGTDGGGIISRFFAMVETFLTFGELAQSTLSLLLFFVVVPMIFDYIDNSSNEAAKATHVPLKGGGGATTGGSGTASSKAETAKEAKES